MNTFKLGLDLHGVIDKDPKFYSRLSKIIMYGGGEVHVITGIAESEAIREELRYLNMSWTHFYSIEDDLIRQGYEPSSNEGDNSLWFPDDVWNLAKGKYCKENQISVHIDDSEIYQQHFDTDVTEFILV